MADQKPERWCDRSFSQYALRTNGTGTGRVLMHRVADDEGKIYDGSESTWRDVATFGSYNDAESVLRKLRA